MNIGIIGARKRNQQSDFKAIRNKFLELYNDGDEIVSGGCPRGGDRFAEIISDEFSVPIKIHPAKWDKHGKAAGFIRNTYIARDSDVLIACVSEDRKGGTEDTIKKFLKNKNKSNLFLV
jgi:hypothetical protein